jgi:tetratricopeptide (TPR) repeat protein
MGEAAKTGRNDACPCGSGKKHKRCCGSAEAMAKRPVGPASPSNESTARLAALAGELMKAGRIEEAIAPLARLAELAPDPERIHDLGMACLLARRVPEALAHLRRAVAMRPDVARSQFSLGLALQQSGDDRGALASYGRAVALAPGLGEAHAKMADLLLRDGRRTEAALAFDRAAAAAPGSTAGQMWRAKALVTRGRTREAEAALRAVIARDPAASGEAHLMLGNLLGEAGRFDEAATSLERSLELAPWQATAHHTLVSLRRITEADRPLYERIVARLEATDVAPRQRMTLHFAAGKALDDLGDYAGAMRHFDAANEIRRRLFPVDRRAFPDQVDRLIGRFTRGFFEAHGALGSADDTPVLVVGMPRSGTTLTERIVASHPSASGGGELAFWNERASTLALGDVASIAAAAPKLAADYLAVLHDIGPGKERVVDKMPGNFLWIGLVHLLFPKARFIHCRRNPVDTCLSLYSTDITGNWGFASDRADLVAYYRDYLRLMEHWRKVIPEDRLLEVDYEAVTGAPEEQTRRIIAWTGLAWDPACLSPEKNLETVRTANKWQARQPVYRTSVERWRKYERWLGALSELLPAEARGAEPHAEGVEGS